MCECVSVGLGVGVGVLIYAVNFQSKRSPIKHIRLHMWHEEDSNRERRIVTGPKQPPKAICCKPGSQMVVKSIAS